MFSTLCKEFLLIFFIETGKKKKNEFGQVLHYDLFGNRQFKYDKLNSSTISSLSWNALELSAPYRFFVPKDFESESNYTEGFRVDELMILNSNGIETKCDSLSIQFDRNSLEKVIDDFRYEEISILKLKYQEKQDSSGWNFNDAKKSILTDKFYFQKINYRPFDIRETVITKKSGGFIGRSRFEVMKHFLQQNIGLIIPRQTTQDYRHTFISNKIIEGNFTASAKLFGTGCIFPLYLYEDDNNEELFKDSLKRKPNIAFKLAFKLAQSINHTYIEDETMLVDLADGVEGVIHPLNILDYIYAVLHSPSYREKYKEFLKIDFPRVPYPTDADKFWKLVALGKELREIHLLESPKVEEYITGYPEDGDNIVGKPKFVPVTSSDPEVTKGSYREEGNVYINETQYFSNVPEVAWNFYIGGYQPAQKWLKDRKDRELSYDDILHYQKIIVALTETDRVMKEIDSVAFFGNDEVNESLIH